MTELLKSAKKLLEEGGYTCVLAREDEVYTATARGVAPLLAFLDSKKSYVGFSAADKVVGAGAAYLYVLLGVRELYARVISENAKRIIEENSISLYSDEVVCHIRNRAGDGICPVEQAVSDARSPEEALCKIRAKLKQLSEAK